MAKPPYDIVEDSEAFEAEIMVWCSKRRLFDGLDIITTRDGLYEPVVLDYATGTTGYLSKGGPYKTHAAAFAAWGRAIDQAEARIAAEIAKDQGNPPAAV